LQVRPNPAHHAIVEIERRVPDFGLITQNVDGLHRLAGSRNIVELHGDIWIDRCTACGHEARVNTVPEGLPACEKCGGLARPGVVWFGEMLPPGAFDTAVAWAANANLVLVIGTSNVVQPAASLADIARSNNATVVEINLEPTALSHTADVALHGKAGEILPRLLDAWPANGGHASGAPPAC
jgi:NAD-dependent deacetylase